MPVLTSRQLLLLGALMLMSLGLGACSGTSRSASSAGADLSSPRSPRPSRPAQPAASPLALPALSKLPRTAAAAPNQRRLDGSDFDPALANARVFVAAAELSYAPAGSTLDTAAFAIYHLDLPDYDGVASVATQWDSPPAVGTFFIGIADYSSNSWLWFAGDPDAAVELPPGADAKSDSNQVYIAIVLTGSAVKALQSLQFGPDTAPVARIRAQQVFGDVGSSFSFDASASSDDVGITKYEWDLNGDGEYELDNEEDPLTEVDFPLAGERTVGLRVTDTIGQTGETTLGITVDTVGYDEVEPNNVLAEANQLPGMGFTRWEGNFGEGGYDGSQSDYYKLEVSEPVRLRFRIETLYAQEFCGLQLFDATGSQLLAASSDGPQNATLIHVFDAPGSFILTCTGGVPPNGIDYWLSAFPDFSPGYDEVEPNNESFNADILDSNGSQTLFASLGEGGYDGGSEDWFRLDVPVDNLHYSFETRALSTECEIDLELRDAVDTLLTRDFDGAEEKLVFNFATSGTYFLRCFARAGQPPGANSDYELTVTNNGPGAQVVLTATPDSGAQPLEVLLDTSTSILPPGSNVFQVYWDYNADGFTELVTEGNELSINVTYFKAGAQSARVVYELDTGAGGQANVDINVSGSSSETEPNNSYDLAQEVFFPLTGFFGDLGPEGNDGGYYDIFSFSAAAGHIINATLDYQPGLLPMALYLSKWDGMTEEVLASSVEQDGSEAISFPITQNGTYYLVVLGAEDWPAGSGYELAGTLTP